ncbi:type II toxin-antitoxin system VapC family toxin [Argonema antarcticum]|uniref:type II toxin-antitoxin system VapC family toxin n=1 Tax=Argonema antarcticum TaxID=2942763 RepID=UPI002011DF44|nr:type II toxin-antitoxin system VapC family toxin [Argonema antarcticum A004/B2]
MVQVILDTDTLSAIMRQNPVVILKATEYLAEQGQFTFSIITRYEILRGLKAKGATKQISLFNEFCAKNIVLPLTDEIVIKAADIYADLKKRGLPTGDADILIAASALVLEVAVVTNNQAHFQRIPHLQVLNWLN